MSTLMGFGRRISWLDWADHTYVKSEPEGYTWPCWGGSDGGNELCKGYGDAWVANLLSFPWGTAQLIYGITGVCHQTANRILFDTGLTVAGARGFWLSSILYGYYGVDFWRWYLNWLLPLSQALSKGAMYNAMDEPKEDVIKLGMQKKIDVVKLGGGLPKKLEAHDTKNEEERKRDYLNKVINHHKDVGKRDDNRQDVNYIEDVLGGEIELTMAYRLGKPLPSRDMKKVRKHYRDFLDVKKEMEDKFNKKELTPEKYADEINKISGKVSRNWNDVLGREKYNRISGEESPKAAFGIVDPALMKAAQKQKVDGKVWYEKAKELESQGYSEAAKTAFSRASELGYKH
jgi:hypothetical protein